jgi:hypothetical protein
MNKDEYAFGRAFLVWKTLLRHVCNKESEQVDSFEEEDYDDLKFEIVNRPNIKITRLTIGLSSRRLDFDLFYYHLRKLELNIEFIDKRTGSEKQYLVVVHNEPTVNK